MKNLGLLTELDTHKLKVVPSPMTFCQCSRATRQIEGLAAQTGLLISLRRSDADIAKLCDAYVR